MIQFVAAGIAAAGLVTSVFTSMKSTSREKRGLKRDEQQAELRIQQERLASNEQALFDLEQLSETLATQRAIQAVRGSLPGVGSNLTIANKSINRFYRDEEARLLSLEFGTGQIRSQMLASSAAVQGRQNERNANLIIGGLNTASAFGSAFGGSKTKAPTTSAYNTTSTKQQGILTPQQRNPDYTLYPKKGK